MLSQESESYSELIRDHKFCPECGNPSPYISKIWHRGSAPEYKCEGCDTEYWQVIV